MVLNDFDKTRIMVFGTRQNQHFDFNLGGHKIDICTDFEFLDVIFSRSRYFHQTRRRKLSKLGTCRKEMHVLFKPI